jgi:hypothetical protein
MNLNGNNYTKNYAAVMGRALFMPTSILVVAAMLAVVMTTVNVRSVLANPDPEKRHDDQPETMSLGQHRWAAAGNVAKRSASNVEDDDVIKSAFNNNGVALDDELRHVVAQRAMPKSLRYAGLGKRKVGMGMRYAGLGKREDESSLAADAWKYETKIDGDDVIGSDRPEAEVDDAPQSRHSRRRRFAGGSSGGAAVYEGPYVKRPTLGRVGAGMRYAGLGKRIRSQVDAGMRYMGLGKRADE